jgi:MFS family permease
VDVALNTIKIIFHPSIRLKNFISLDFSLMSQISTTLKQFSQNTFSSLKIRNYRLYYMGQVISTSGTFMQSVAQAWLVLTLTHSGTALGIVTALQYLPILILGTFGGIAADRFSKRKILFFTQSAAGLLALVLGILVATNSVTLWMVYVLAFGLGMVNVFDNPTRQTFVIEMVGADEVRNAVTLYSSLVNLSRIIGPAIAALLISAAGLAPCFIINGVSYAAVVIMLAMMRPAELLPAPPAPRSKGQLRAGLDYVRSTPVLAFTLVMMAIIGTLTYEFQVSLPLVAQFTFKGDASSYAFLTAAMGVGAVIGGLAIAGRKDVVPSKLVGAALLFGLTVLAAAVMPTLMLVGLAMVLVGVFSIYFTSLGNSVLQLNSAPHMRGRVMSFWSMAFLGSTTIGGPLVGWFAGVAGPRWGLALGGFAALAAAAIGAIALRNARAHPMGIEAGEETKEKTRFPSKSVVK